MSDSVVIKEIETETILLEEVEIGVFTGKSWLKLCAGFIIFLGVGWSMAAVAFSISPPPNPILPPITFGIFAGVLSVLFFGALGAFHDGTLAYSVGLQARSDTRIFIPKTTPGNDQVAICRASKELEDVARSFIKKERELEQIAQKCK